MQNTASRRLARTDSPEEYDLVILGSGAGGKLAAWTYAQHRSAEEALWSQASDRWTWLAVRCLENLQKKLDEIGTVTAFPGVLRKRLANFQSEYGHALCESLQSTHSRNLDIPY